MKKRFALGDEDEQDSVTDDGKSSEEKAFQALVRRKTLALQRKRQAVQSVMQNWMRLSAKNGKPWIQASTIRKMKNMERSLKALYDSFGGEDQYWEYMREETRTSSEIEKYFADKENEYKEQAWL